MIKTGNIFLIIMFVCASLFAAPSVKISVYDSNHKPVTQVGQYSQFIIEVTCTDIKASSAAPTHISGFDACQAQSISQKHSTQVYNGHTTRSVTFVYTAQCPEQGEYVLGPCTIDGVISNTVKIRVAQRTVNTQQNNTQRSEVIVDAAIAGDEFFLGQAIPVMYTVRISEDIDPQECDAHIVQSPYFDVGTVKTLGDVQYELYNGKEYKVETYQAFMYPKRAGTLSVPPMQVTYLVPSHSMLDFFGFGGLSKQKKGVTSNVVPCIIKELPHGVSANQFIGAIDSIDIQIEKTQISLGQGTILKIIVQGKGDHTKIPFFQIQTSDELRVYENKELVHATKDGSFVKTLEYVVQGVKEGVFEIPQQTLSYFDVQKEKIQKYVFGKNIKIEILPGAKSSVDVLHDQSFEKSIVQEQDNHNEQVVISVTADSWYTWAGMILWMWYLLWCMLAWLWLQKLFFIGLHYSLFIKKIYGYCILLWWRFAQRRCRSVQELLQGWRSVFEKLCYVVQKEDLFKEHDYKIVLQAMQVDVDSIEQWNTWYAQVLQQLYGQGDVHILKNLLQESAAWTVLLQGKIWRIQ